MRGTLVLLKLILKIVKPSSSDLKKALPLAVENYNHEALAILLKHILPNYNIQTSHLLPNYNARASRDSLPVVFYHVLSMAAYNSDWKSLEILLKYKPNLNAIFVPNREEDSGQLTSIIPEGITSDSDSDYVVYQLLRHGASARWPDSIDRLDELYDFTPLGIKRLHAAGARPSQLPDNTSKPGAEDQRTYGAIARNPNIMCMYPTGMDKVDTTSTLAAQCREFIRNHLMEAHKENLFLTVPRLPLPELVKSFLLFNVRL